MERASVADAEPAVSKAEVKRRLSDALGTTDVALNYYELDPGDEFSNALHAHLDQEELFYVRSGTATFETDDDVVTAAAGEVIRFAPGEYQYGYNDGDERVVALAIGAPKDSTDVRLVCGDCGARAPPDRVPQDGGDVLVYYCGDCGAEISRMRR